MLPFLPLLPVAQVAPAPAPAPQVISRQAPQEIWQPQEVRPLPGQLDAIPFFNSNSPELVRTEGILLSTFAPEGKQVPRAHLNFPFEGRFNLFAHHTARAETANDSRSLFFGVIVYNPGTQPITVDVLQAASYLSNPDAPFIELPSHLENPIGRVYAGPGSRAMNDILRGRRQSSWPAQIIIAPGQSQMLVNLPIPGSNSRSTMMRLWSSGPVYVASLAMFARAEPGGRERPPTLAEWETLLNTRSLAGPRDRAPTPLETATESLLYGRVAGVAQGSEWRARLTDSARARDLSIPRRGQAFSYGLSTLDFGTFGTGQIQSAPMLVRYPDTAYRAHGNYGIEYNLTLPLRNASDQPQSVALTIQTPIKEDQPIKGGLRFFLPPEPQVFFRGTVRLRYNDDLGLSQTRYIHLVQRRGQQGDPLVTFSLRPGERRLVQVDFLYPPDSTPPQVLTVQTLDAQTATTVPAAPPR